jgi:hypothetical protein
MSLSHSNSLEILQMVLPKALNNLPPASGVAGNDAPDLRSRTVGGKLLDEFECGKNGFAYMCTVGSICRSFFLFNISAVLRLFQQRTLLQAILCARDAMQL